MKRYGIERQTLLVTLIPIAVMAVLLEGYFVLTRFSDLDRSMMERAQLLTHQLASSCEYAVFSGNTVILKQNADSALSFQDVKQVGVYDAQSKLIIASGSNLADLIGKAISESAPVFQDEHILRLYEPITATQIDMDGLLSDSPATNRLGAVVIEFSKHRLNNQKKEFLLFSVLFTLLAVTIALILAMRTARRITGPVLEVHQAVRRIGEGDLDITLTSESNIRELSELSNGIAEMAQHLMRDRNMLENRIVETTDGLRNKHIEIEKTYLEKEALNENLAIALGEMQAIMEANPDILYVFNKKAELVQWNSSFAQFFGFPAEKMPNMPLRDFVCEEERDEIELRMRDVYTQGTVVVEAQLLRHDGVKVPYLCNAVVLKNRHGEITGFTGTGRDISERKAAAEQMQHMAHYDFLTDLPNRSLLSDRLRQAIVSSKRTSQHIALMFLDLDMFKYINDKHGHAMGDLLLKEVAHRIVQCLRESDTAARIGGDEFVVLLPAVENVEDAVRVAEKIRHKIALPFDIAGHSMNISVSIGIAVYPDHGMEEKALLKNADTAMYLAKNKGRNTVVVYST